MGWPAKSRAHKILEYDPTDDPLERAIDISLTGLVLLNVAAVILETVEGIHSQYGVWFTAFEIFSVAVFTVEYVLRLWTCTVDKRYAGPVLGRIRFALTPLLVIDLLAVLPFYLPMFLPIDLRFVRAARLLRLFKMTRYSRSLKTFGRVLYVRRQELSLTIFLVALLGNRIQPDVLRRKRSPARGILQYSRGDVVGQKVEQSCRCQVILSCLLFCDFVTSVFLVGF